MLPFSRKGGSQCVKRCDAAAANKPSAYLNSEPDVSHALLSPPPQSVKSIEERTRPNLCKTLKGKQSCRCSSPLPAGVRRGSHTLTAMFISLHRAGAVGRPGVSGGGRHHSSNGSLQAQFHPPERLEQLGVDARAATHPNIRYPGGGCEQRCQQFFFFSNALKWFAGSRRTSD